MGQPCGIHESSQDCVCCCCESLRVVLPLVACYCILRDAFLKHVCVLEHPRKREGQTHVHNTLNKRKHTHTH